MPGAFAGLPDKLRQTFGALRPGVELDFHEFVPSGMLADELLQGAETDIFVSANTRYMTDLWNAGRVPSPRLLAGNRLCIIVDPAYKDRVGNLEDLLQAGLVVVTPQPQTDPCGQYIAQMWKRAGMEEANAAKTGRGELVHSRGSGDLPGFLADGRAQAGVFYASEARSLGSKVIEVPIPESLDAHEQIAFTIGAVRSVDDEPREAAGDFVDFMTGPAGQALLVEHGFAPASHVDPVHAQVWQN